MNGLRAIEKHGGVACPFLPAGKRVQILFFVWVDSSEQKWVILAERRGVGLASIAGHGIAHSPCRTLHAAQRLLRIAQYFSAAGLNGTGADWLAGTTALPRSWGVGRIAGAGSRSGSADAPREVENPVPASRAGGTVECGTGQTVDDGGAAGRTSFLYGRARARVSRDLDRSAEALRSPATALSAGQRGLLDQCHGWEALPLFQSACGSRFGGGATGRPDAVVGGQRPRERGAPAAHGRRSPSAAIYRNLRPGGL